MASPLKRAARKLAVSRRRQKQPGDSIPIPYVSKWQSGRPIWNDWSTENAIKFGLKANVWVYACQRKLASAASSVPWYVEGTDDDGRTWKRIPGHPIETLLSEANPFMSGQDLFERLVYHLYLGGNGIWKLIFVNGMPVELWPLPPDKVKPIPDPKEFISSYKYEMSAGEKPKFFDPREVVHFQFVDPSNPYWGLSPLKAAAMIIDTDVEAVRWNKVALQNRAIKDGFIFPDQPLTVDQWEEARRTLREDMEGPDNARGLWLAMGPGSVQALSMTPAEMDWLESRKFSVAEIAAVHGVPVVLLSAERTTYNNMITARRIFWEDTVIPLLDDLAEAINMALIPYWDPESSKPGVPPKLRVVYDTSNIKALQENFGEKVSNAQKLYVMGVPFNDINQRLELGFDEIPGGDQPRGGTPQFIASSGQILEQIKIQHKDPFTEEEKTMLWKARDSERLQWEKRIGDEIAKHFEREGEAVAKAFVDRGTLIVGRVIDEQSKNLKSILTASYLAIIEFFGMEEAERLNEIFHGKASHTKQFTFDPFSNVIRMWVASVIARKITYMTTTTKEAIGRTIGDGLINNLDTRDIAASIIATYQQWGSPPDDSDIDLPRAYMIARTETGAAMNGAVMEASKQFVDATGSQITKTWISSRDMRVRESHKMVDGETVGLEESFSNGLLYPLDPNSVNVAEVINCRCTHAVNVIR